MTTQEQHEDADGLWLFPRYHLFGSDELSVYTKGIADLVAKGLHMHQYRGSSKEKLEREGTIELDINERKFQFEVKIEDDVANGIALAPYGIRETYGIEYPVRLK